MLFFLKTFHIYKENRIFFEIFFKLDLLQVNSHVLFIIQPCFFILNMAQSGVFWLLSLNGRHEGLWCLPKSAECPATKWPIGSRLLWWIHQSQIWPGLVSSHIRFVSTCSVSYTWGKRHVFFGSEYYKRFFCSFSFSIL